MYEIVRVEDHLISEKKRNLKFRKINKEIIVEDSQL